MKFSVKINRNWFFLLRMLILNLFGNLAPRTVIRPRPEELIRTQFSLTLIPYSR